MTYTIKQIADLYHVTPRTVKQWARAGKLTLIPKPGRGWIVTGLPEEAAENWNRRAGDEPNR